MFVATAVRTAWGLAFIGVAVAAAGCGAGNLDSFAGRADAVDARHIADTVASGDLASVLTRFDESQRPIDPEIAAQKLAHEVPPGPRLDIQMVGYQSTVTKIVGRSTTEMSGATFESKYPRGYLITTVLLRRVDDGQRRIVGLRVQAQPESMAARNAFSLTGKDLNHYTVLFAMIAVVAVTVRALHLWFRRRRITRRKWWWLLAILLGAFKLSIDWTTGAFTLQALTIQFFLVSVTRGGSVGPWILSLSFPAGAIAFMMNASLADGRPPVIPPVPPAPSSRPGIC